MYDDFVRFFDAWNILGGAGVVFISGYVSSGFVDFTPQGVLVAVTALYAFIAFNQMREARWNRRPSSHLAVRPHFRRNDDTDTCDFGLKNFGDSPALNFRLRALLREGDDRVGSLTISSRNQHLHLEENEFWSLIEDVPEKDGFGNLTDADDSVFENYGQKSIELYYTFESKDGVQYPRDWYNPTKMDMGDVVAKSEAPRTVQLAEIREKCT